MKQQYADRRAPHSVTLSQFQVNQSLLFLLKCFIINAVCFTKKQQIPI
jgi:hypothetical protein